MRRTLRHKKFSEFLPNQFQSSAATCKLAIRAADYPVGNIVTLNDISGNGRTLTLTGTWEVFINSEGRKAFRMTGSNYATDTTSKTYWNFTYQTSFRWVVYFVGKVNNPNSLMALCGSDGIATANVGMNVFFDDRSSVPRTKSIGVAMNRGVTGTNNWLMNVISQNVTETNQRIQHLIYCDSTVTQDTLKIFTNDYLVAWGSRTANAQSNLDPTYNFQIGAGGNNVFPMTGEIEEFYVYAGQIRSDFRAVLNGYSKPVLGTVGGGKVLNGPYQLVIDDGVYNLGTWIDRNPATGKLIAVSNMSGNHFQNTAPQNAQYRESADNGANWSSVLKTIAITAPSGTSSFLFGGYNHAGNRIALTFATREADNSFDGLYTCYSDDEMSTFSTPVAKSLPDGIVYYAPHNPLARLGSNRLAQIVWGTVQFPYVVSANHGVYALVSDDNWVTTTFKQIFFGAQPLNESALLYCGSNTVVCLCRKEVIDGSPMPLRWFKSTDNADTWSAVGGDWIPESTNTVAHPPYLSKCSLNGVELAAFWYLNRSTWRLTVRFCKLSDLASAPNTAFDGKTVWILDIPQMPYVGTPATNRSGYPNVIHPDVNDPFHFVGMTHFEKSATASIRYFFNSNGMFSGEKWAHIKSRVASELMV